MSWVPVSSCTTACTADPAPTVDPATRRRRWLRLTGALAGAGATALQAPLTSARGRRRILVCAAARVLTAVGVRVEVHSSPTAWPRAGAGRGPGQLVVSNHVSWVDDLAMLTVVPGLPVAKREVAGWPLVGGLARRAGVVLLDRGRIRTLPGTVGEAADLLRTGTPVTVHPEGTTSCGVELGRFRPAFFQAAVDAAAPVCPVAVRYRVDGGSASAVAGYLADEPLWRSIARVVRTRGLVVEVHLLPALDPAGADRRELAALAEYAVAAVTEARPPVVTAHPRRPRVPARPVPVRRQTATPEPPQRSGAPRAA
ncbi:lysophospholipid acyltransferase family protein [Modestobacter italicus]|uniref:lysophospholipid acyltransferase family protein n=1 Tax=Modestobacter italicus (strain DSM 44449 / CECT 9708 / BC 501) TaxID=2732864 RepID=UPI001C965A12|nr:lysophospholipid acyltransferase family protein [Modestobacter italicus]